MTTLLLPMAPLLRMQSVPPASTAPWPLAGGGTVVTTRAEVETDGDRSTPSRLLDGREPGVVLGEDDIFTAVGATGTPAPG